MTDIPAPVSFLAAVLLAALGLLLIVRGHPKPQKTFFILTVWVLAATQGLSAALLLQTAPGSVLFLSRFALLSIVLSAALAVPFFLLFGKRDERSILRVGLPWMGLGIAAVVTAAALLPAASVIRAIHFSEVDGRLWGFALTRFGNVITIYVIVAVVAALYFFENTWRNASLAEKTTLKYPLLGVAAASLLILLPAGRAMALSQVDRTSLAIQSCGFVLMSLSFLFATIRYRLFDVEVYVGREVTSSAVSVVITGVYLLGLGIISYLANMLGIAFDKLTLQVLGIFAVFSFVAIMMSGRVRRRIRHYVGENFYLNRYDYRTEWRRHARLMTSSGSVDEFISDFIVVLCETMMVRRGYIWVDLRGGKEASYGVVPGMMDDERTSILSKRARGGHVEPLYRTMLDAGPGGVEWCHLLAGIGSGGELAGFVVLGEREMDLKYTDEDSEFLATVSDQAALTLENFQMSEKIGDAQQMDTFNRFASFVIHDLKNTMNMLSLTADNAKENIRDAEFQRDAMETIRRSVDKMRHIIRSLAVFRAPPTAQLQLVDLETIVGGVVESRKLVARRRGVDLEFSCSGPLEADVDPAAIERIVENLVQNAVDASVPGGRVHVQASREATGGVVVIVSDEGEGFDAAYLENHVFRPFQTTKKEGLGIGLVMCKSLVESHGGRIAIGRGEDGGAAVTFWLPAPGAHREGG